MPTLPELESSLLVRTDFTSDDAWQQISAAAQEENEDGFRAYIEPISDSEFDGLSWEEVKAAVPGDDPAAAVLFIADSTTLTAADHPILVVDLLDDGNLPFRCIPSELWSVDNNLNIANMDWKDFADTLDHSGIFRGFNL
jgi:hypothetical protein